MDVGFPNMSRELNATNIICLESKSPNPLNGKTSGLNGPKLVDPAPSMGSSSSRAIGAAFPGPRDSTGKGDGHMFSTFQVYFSRNVGFVRLGGKGERSRAEWERCWEEERGLAALGRVWVWSLGLVWRAGGRVWGWSGFVFFGDVLNISLPLNFS